MEKFESQAAVTGLGMSEVGRRLMRDPLALTIDACLASIDDAGLTRDDIDGLATYPGNVIGGGGGISGAGIWEVEDALRIHPKWFNGGMEQAGQLGSVITAVMAVATGLCRHVLCFRTVWESTYQAMQRSGEIPPPSGGRVGGDMQWRIPYGAASAANWIALYASRHFHEYGTTREQLGQIALNARKNAALTDYAIYRDPMTMDDYLSARMITTPFGLYDCDVPCDASVAFIVSHRDTARDTRRGSGIRFEAVGTANTERVSWDQCELTHEVGLQGPADMMWSRTDLKPADVDMAQLYDGFSFNCMCWLERLGFCPEGEGGRFVEGGKRIARDGELPLNTNGGQLSAGRLHGYGFLHEACTQLWGEAGERQIPNSPEVAVASSGGGVPGSAMLVTKI
jgi:acetyl-CoA acetyltransferase